jgi:mono/diheme cytochrome c family protein
MKKLLLVGALSLVGCRGGESEKPPVHIIKNMDTQEKGKPYRKDTTGLFADGRVSRPPVEGTVAIGQLGDDDLLEKGLDEKLEVSQSFHPSVDKDNWDAAAARGKNRYNIYCAPCHGPKLDGQGTVAQKGLDGKPRLTVPPPDLHSERIAKEMIVGKIYSAIVNGVNEGNMPSYASQISADDRWAIVAYVKSAQMLKDPSVPKTPGKAPEIIVVSANAEDGAKLYKARTCNTCHSIDGTKIVGPSFKGLWGRTESTDKGDVVVDDAYFTESVKEPMAKIVKDYPPAMAKIVISDLEIKSIALYVQTLK